MTNVIDISKWQGTYNANTAKAAGQTIGAYGFATWHYRSKNGGNLNTARVAMMEQTNAWIAICDNLLDGYFAIDQELEAGYTMGLTKSDNETLLNECIALLQAAGFVPCIYCSASWAMTQFNKDNVHADLWLAYYYADPFDPNFGQEANYQTANGVYFAYMRSLGTQLCGWQFGRIGYGATYGVGSKDVDRNIFYKNAVPTLTVPPLSDTPVRLICGYATSGDMLTIMLQFNALLIPFTVGHGYVASINRVSRGDQIIIASLCASLGIPCKVVQDPPANILPSVEGERLPTPEINPGVDAKPETDNRPALAPENEANPTAKPAPEAEPELEITPEPETSVDTLPDKGDTVHFYRVVLQVLWRGMQRFLQFLSAKKVCAE